MARAKAPGAPPASAGVHDEPHTQAARRHRLEREEQTGFPPALGLLEIAVPMWIERLRHLTWEEKMKVRDEALVGLGIGTDDADALDGIANFACGGRGKPGHVAGAFNALAKGLALGALQPGGVTFCDQHWEATPALPSDLGGRPLRSDGLTRLLPNGGRRCLCYLQERIQRDAVTTAAVAP